MARRLVSCAGLETFPRGLSIRLGGGRGKGVKVGYFMDVSLRNCSMSKGEDLTLAVKLNQTGRDALEEKSLTRSFCGRWEVGQLSGKLLDASMVPYATPTSQKCFP